MRAAALLLATLLLAGCEDTAEEDEQIDRADDEEAEPVGFPEETACEAVFALVAAADPETDDDLVAILEEEGSQALDVVTLLDPTNEDGTPNRVGELVHRFAETDDADEMDEIVEELRGECP